MITNPKNISDLYSYTATGMELGYDYKQKQSWDVDVSYRQENRDFATPPPVSSPEQDHTYTKLGATFGYEMGTNWRAEFDVAKAKRDYDFRHAHNLDGGYSTVVLTYDFTDFGITIKQDVNQKLKMSYGYATIARTDNNVGYNDYDLS